MLMPYPLSLSLSCSCPVGCLLLPIFWQWCARAYLFAYIPAHKYIERNLCLHLFKVLLILLSFSDILVVVVVVLAEGRLHLSHVVFPLSVCVCVHMWDYLHMGLSVCGLPSLRMQKSASEINTKKGEGKQQHNIKLAKKSKTKRRTGNASGSSRQHESCTETRPTSQGSSPGVCSSCFCCCCCYCCCVSVTQISCGVLRACLPLFLSLSLAL